MVEKKYAAVYKCTIDYDQLLNELARAVETYALTVEDIDINKELGKVSILVTSGEPTPDLLELKPAPTIWCRRKGR
jgi:hypothetical protein